MACTLRVADRHVEEVPAAGQERAEHDAEDDDRERHQRARGRHAELGAGAFDRAARARDPAERPQVDPDDGQPVAARDERMAELVQDQRGEEAQHGGDRDQVGGRDRAAEHFVERFGDDVDEEEQHDEPADADADADPEEAGDLEVGAHCHIFMVGAGLTYAG